MLRLAKNYEHLAPGAFGKIVKRLIVRARSSSRSFRCSDHSLRSHISAFTFCHEPIPRAAVAINDQPQGLWSLPRLPVRRPKRRPDVLPGIVDPGSGTLVAAQRAQVPELSLVVDKSARRVGGIVSPAHYLTCIVDSEARASGITRQRAQVHRLSVAVKKSMKAARKRREISRDLSSIVESRAEAVRAPKGSQIRHLPATVEKGRVVLVNICKLEWARLDLPDSPG